MADDGENLRIRATALVRERAFMSTLDLVTVRRRTL